MLSREQVLEGALLHIKEYGLTKAGFGTICGIPARRMQKIFKGDTIPTDEEIRIIACMARLGEPELSTPKKAKAKKQNVSNGMYLKGNQILDDFMRVSGIDNRTLANTMLVILGWDTLIKLGASHEVLDFLEEVAKSECI